MTNEELILERLDRIEARIIPLAETAMNMKELKNDLMTVVYPISKTLINELQSVESAFQLEDLGALSKRLLRSVKNLIYALNQLENIIDFVKTLEPVLKLMVPQIIDYLDGLEQRGVFRIMSAAYDTRAKIAATYTAGDIEEIGDGFVASLGILQKLSDPRLAVLLENLAEQGAGIDLSKSKGVNVLGFLAACSKADVKKGLCVLLELTKALGRLKTGSLESLSGH
jgi:uncharacterized protein YjgD (DUF1641 family)